MVVRKNGVAVTGREGKYVQKKIYLSNKKQNDDDDDDDDGGGGGDYDETITINGHHRPDAKHYTVLSTTVVLRIIAMYIGRRRGCALIVHRVK